MDYEKLPASVQSSSIQNTADENDYYLHSHSELPPYRRNRWVEKTKRYRDQIIPEQRLIEQISAINGRDMSMYIYRSSLRKKRKMKEMSEIRDLEPGKGTVGQTNISGLDDDPTNDSGKYSSLVAWPLRPKYVSKPYNPMTITPGKRKVLHRWQEPSHSRLVPKNAIVDLLGRGRNTNLIFEDSDAAAADIDSDVDADADDQVEIPAIFADQPNEAFVSNSEVYMAESDPRPRALLEDVLIAHLMKLGKERFRQGLWSRRFKTGSYTLSVDDEIMTFQLQPVVHEMIGKLDDLLLGLHQQARGRLGTRKILRDWKTIMLMASLKAWPKNVIKRAEMRCKNIFERPKSSGKHGQNAAEEHLFGEEARRVCKELVCPFKSCSRNTKRFPRLQYLIIHVKSKHPWIHIGFTCPVGSCPRKNNPFYQKRYLNDHVKEQHLWINSSTRRKSVNDTWQPEKLQDGKLACPVGDCPRKDQGFSRRWNLNQHLEKMHPEWWTT